MTGGASRPWRAALILAGVALVAAGCNHADSLDVPSPPRVASAAPTTSSTTPFDAESVTEPTVVGATTTTTVALGPGGASITGTVLGPSGPVGGATVQVQRLVGDQAANTFAVTSPGGSFTVGQVLGGRYRLRAWQTPTLAMTAPAIFFVGNNATYRATLQMSRFAGPQVTAAFAPDPSVDGQPTTIAVEVSRPRVSAAGIVSYPPAAGAAVRLAGAWTVTGSGQATTGPGGVARFVASCDSPGIDPLTAVIGGVTPASLHVPRCLPPPPPPTTTTSSTTTTSTTTVPPPTHGGPPPTD